LSSAGLTAPALIVPVYNPLPEVPVNVMVPLGLPRHLPNTITGLSAITSGTLKGFDVINIEFPEVKLYGCEYRRLNDLAELLGLGSSLGF